MIYFAQAVDGGPIKIGTTTNLGARIRQLESLYRRPLTVLATLKGGRNEERAIHDRFAHLRFGRTEQFQPAPELMNFIGRPLFVNATAVVEPMPSEGRDVVLNLKGSPEYAAWFDAVHEKTHIPKTMIVRIALTKWARDNGHDEPPPI